MGITGLEIIGNRCESCAPCQGFACCSQSKGGGGTWQSTRKMFNFCSSCSTFCSSGAWLHLGGQSNLHVGGDECSYVWGRQLGSAQTAPTATPQLITSVTNHLSCPYVNFPSYPREKGATCLISGLRELPAPRIFCLLTEMRVSCTRKVSLKKFLLFSWTRPQCWEQSGGRHS